MARPAAAPKPTRSIRVPPHSEEAERGVLGSMLLAPDKVVDLCIERGLRPESFYHPAHRQLFETLVDMLQDARPIDLLTVGARLKDLGQLDRLGGQAYLDQLVDATPTPAHADYYIGLVFEKSLLRTIIDRASNAIEKAYDSEREASELLGETEQSFFEVANLQRSAFTPWSNLVKNTMQHIEMIYQNKIGVTGTSTGYQDLDKILLGMQPSDILIVAARPSMGKTSLALNIVENVALGDTPDHKNRPVAVFSLEMSSEQLVKRMVCSRSGVSGHDLATGYLSAASHGRLMTAADALRKAHIYLDDTPGLSALELRSRARRLKRKYDIQLIVVDYLQLMNYPEYAREGRQREVSAISGSLKAMAKELNVPVMVLSQLSRAPETRDRLAIPKLSDLRDSGSIEQDADVVILLRRPSRYPDDPEHDDERLAVLDVAKHRNGPVGFVHLNFEESLMRFTNRTRVRPDEEPPPQDGGEGDIHL